MRVVYAVGYETGYGLEEPYYTREWEADWQAWRCADSILRREANDEARHEGLFWLVLSWHEGWAARAWPRDTIAWVRPIEVRP